MARVFVCDPYFPLDVVREELTGRPESVEPVEGPWEGDDVVGLLVGPDYPVGAAELERLPALRAVATCSVGFDHIDLDAASQRGVWVTNIPDYCIEEMADSTIALLLSLLRGVVVLDRSVRAGRWDHTAAGTLRRLSDTRLGVIGFGRIGRAVAAKARALDLEVWATDSFVPDGEIEAAGVRPAPLRELLASCTAFTLHTPLTPETEGLIGTGELDLMPHGSVLVDTARARLLDLDAVLAALDDGRLAAAALDVLPVEPPSAQHPPPEHPRLVVNPHAAWYSPDTEQASYRRPVRAIRAVLEGRVPDGAVAGPEVPA